MSRAPFIVIDGKAYRWKDVLDLRRAQLAAAEAAQGSQLALFATLHDDRRPPARRRGAILSLQPSPRVLCAGNEAIRPSGGCASMRNANSRTASTKRGRSRPSAGWM
jgi:hypothetical protein